MSIEKGRNLLEDESASEKTLQKCIDSLRRESRYVKNATRMGYRSEFAGNKTLDEIENLIYELAEKLIDISGNI